MWSESILASIETATLSKQGPATTLPVIKDAAIFNISLRPHFNPKTTFKKSSTRPNTVAVTDNHVFAAQADKAVVHVYAKDKGNQELTVSFGEKVTALTAAGEGGVWVVCGLESGGVLVWETHTGRLVKAQQSHVQAVSAIAVDKSSRYFLTGSADSTILVWTFASILSYAQASDESFSNSSSRVPQHTLTTHRAPITGVATGHSNHSSNFAVSISEDKSASVWHISTGSLLRTYLLIDIPRSLVLDPADRSAYIGYQDGSIQSLDFYSAGAIVSVADENGVYASIQVDPKSKWNLPAATTPQSSSLGAAICLSVSFDGSRLMSGHQSGKISTWDIGNGRYDGDVCILPGAVTNLQFLNLPELPAAQLPSFKVVSIMRPKLDSNNSNDLENAVFNGELIGNLTPFMTQPLAAHQSPVGADFSGTISMIGFPEDLLWEGVNQLQEIQEQREKKSANAGKSTVPMEQSEDFISLEAEEDNKSDDNEDGVRPTGEPKTLLEQQVKSLQNTQKESFKIMRELRKEREILLKELNQYRGTT